MSIRILLADDHKLVREGLRALLEKQPGMIVVAEAADGQEALQLACDTKPDVVVMDIAMPVMNGIDAIRLIAAKLPESKIMVLSMHGHRQIVMEVLRAGATGYMLKDCAQEDLAQAIRAVDANLTFLSPGIADSVLEEYLSSRLKQQDSPMACLTKRERLVCKLLAEGKSARVISSELDVCVRTIENYRRTIMRKLELNNNAALTKYAVRIGLTNLDA
jgi:DNA-binding NarL/FixJ family response regulator